jgi:hypothetical protein
MTERDSHNYRTEQLKFARLEPRVPFTYHDGSPRVKSRLTYEEFKQLEMRRKHV